MECRENTNRIGGRRYNIHIKKAILKCTIIELQKEENSR